ncbi:hypothetical protein D3C72_2032240 [compost metagenome]
MAVVVDAVGIQFAIGIVITQTDASTLVQAFTLRGHGVCCVLNDELVKAFQHALGMFCGEHPAIFGGVRLQIVIVIYVGVTVVNAQFQGTAWVDFHLR